MHAFEEKNPALNARLPKLQRFFQRGHSEAVAVCGEGAGHRGLQLALGELGEGREQATLQVGPEVLEQRGDVAPAASATEPSKISSTRLSSEERTMSAESAAW